MRHVGRHDVTARVAPMGGVILVLGATLAPLAACERFSSDEPGADAAVEGASGSDGSVLEAPDADPTLGDASPLTDGGKAQLVAFVTALGYADVTTPAAADAKCQGEALGRLGGRFVAWLSGAGSPAPSRLVDSGGRLVDGPWFRRDGKRIVATRAALLDTKNTPLENPITITAAGTSVTFSVWTGTFADGGVGTLCPQPAPTTGTASQTGPGWTEQVSFNPTCPSSLAVYCFQVD